MSVQWYVFETLTGQILQEFTPKTGTWTSRLNEAETLDVTIPLTNPTLARMDWRNLGTAWKHSLLVDVDGRLYGGPIQPHAYTPGDPLKIAARGFRSITAARRVLPLTALYAPLVLSNGEPNTDLDTRHSDLDFGTIGKKYVQQMCTWPASNYPIDFEADRTGKRERTVDAIDLKLVDDALSNLSGVENGPDFDFRLFWVDDGRSRVRWSMVSGTEQQPLLQGPDPVVWDVAAAKTAGSAITIRTNPSRMGSLSWAVAGRGDDSILASRFYDSYLVDNGAPLLEIVDNSHTNVTRQETLDGWARSNLRYGRKWSEFWSFRASLVRGPKLRDFRVGDLCQVVVSGDPYVPDGTYQRRVLELSGDEQGLWVDITCGEDYNL